MIRRLGRLVLCALMIAALSNSANAYTIFGMGMSSCGKWTADRQNAGDDSEAAFIDESFVEGFLSGVGYIGIDSMDPLKGTDPEGLFAWIDNYCKANPVQNIGEAAAAFANAHPN